MASFTITVPDAAVSDVVDALCAQGGFQTGQGLTKAQFARTQIRSWIATAYVNYKADTAATAAAATAQTDAAATTAQITVA